MEKHQLIALIIGILGLVGMFFFPEPETNFIYYFSFIICIILAIVFILKIKKEEIIE